MASFKQSLATSLRIDFFRPNVMIHLMPIVREAKYDQANVL